MDFGYPDGPGADPLFDLQLHVARRADVLAREQGSTTLLNLHCWLVAEAEVFGRQWESRQLEGRRSQVKMRMDLADSRMVVGA